MTTETQGITETTEKQEPKETTKPFTPYDPNRAGVQLHHNNSGGKWWLNEKDEGGLIAEGWLLDISEDSFLGRHISYAFLPDVDIKQALASFRKATQFTGRELGCFSCCGSPFSFTQYDQIGKSIEWWSPKAPVDGDDYEWG